MKISKCVLWICLVLSICAIPNFGAQSQNNSNSSVKTSATWLPEGELLQNIKFISIGRYHTCAVTNSGGVKCWGYGYGATGDAGIYAVHPVDILGLSEGMAEVAAGYDYTCVLTESGGVKCWGFISSMWHAEPTYISGLESGVVSLSAGPYHVCVVTTAGAAFCWGENRDGQLGTGDYNSRSIPTQVVGLTSGVKSISAGLFFTCAVMTNGDAKCWGRGGLLGAGVYEDQLTPVNVVGLAGITSKISVGESHSCALKTNNQVVCWGSNSNGQIGVGPQVNVADLPMQVGDLPEGILDISTGRTDSCAITAENLLMCWGGFMFWFDEFEYVHWTPEYVEGVSQKVKQMVSREDHQCALLSVGTMKCWGSDWYGELGGGEFTSRPTGNFVKGLPGEITSVATSYHFTCALNDGGGVYCWGYNSGGGLGVGHNHPVFSPAPVQGLSSGVQAISAGFSNSCALLTTGGVKCWGGGGIFYPIDITGLSSGVTSITSGESHHCVIMTGGIVKCWGNNLYGQLGNGTNTYSSIPVFVVGLSTDVKSIIAGRYHTCAILNDGSVNCWGSNTHGELGTGSTSDFESVPQSVTGLPEPVTSLALGNSYTCAITRSGEAYCWGYNYSGQIGDGTKEDRLIPTQVNGLPTAVISIAASSDTTCAVTVEGKTYCWGDNQYGQLGNDSPGSLLPLKVNGLEANVDSVYSSYLHVCGLAKSGDVVCWGKNNFGQLGDNRHYWIFEPIDVLAKPAPKIRLSQTSGDIGSFFTVMIDNLIPDSTASLKANEAVLSPTFETDILGNASFFLSATSANYGYYQLTVDDLRSTTTGIFITDFYPINPQAGGGLTLYLTDNSLPYYLSFLPVTLR